MTYGSGMWDEFRDEDRHTRLVRDAFAETEKEIFDSALDQESRDAEPSAWHDPRHDMEDIDGETKSDDEWMGEDGEESPPEQYDEQPQEQHDPQPEIFADPEAHTDWVLRQAARNHLPGLNYGQPTQRPDMFADPEGHTNWLLGEMARMSGVHERAQANLDNSFSSAHEQQPEVFKAAWNLLNTMPVQNRRAAIADLINRPDPGNYLVSEYVAARAKAEHQRKHGLPYHRELLSALPVNHAERARGLHYERPTTRAEQEEEDIFNSAWDD